MRSPLLLPKISLTAVPPIIVAVALLCLAQTVTAQTNEPATHSRVTLDNGTDSVTSDDWRIFPFDNFDGAVGLGIANSLNSSAAYFRSNAPAGSLSLSANGVGIGLSAFSVNALNNAEAALHVVGGGAAPGPFQSNYAFDTARVLVEDRNTNEALRELLRLKNNGGSAIHFEDTSAFDGHFKLENVIGQFEIANVNRGAVNLRIDANAAANLLNLTEDGIGIGTAFPDGTIHALADGTSNSLGTANMVLEVTNDLVERTRSMVQLKNNGPILQTFTDTSTTEPGIYQISAASDRFSIQQFNNNRAGMVMFADGAIRFVANAQANFTVTGSGTLNVVGSGAGGGNMNVGLGANIGPTDGNLFVKRDITYGGALNGPSDVNIKENFEEIDPKEILRKVTKLPITRWNYITDDNKTSHVGPMAQDFMAAFKVGSSDKHISMMDSDGVSLAAIKGLSQIVEERDETIARLKLQLKKQANAIAAQDEAITELSEGLRRLESLVAPASN